MFTTGCNYSKFKSQLKLALHRLKLLEKKKTELAQKSRREIADYISSGKIERAKIRVEHIIREDYLVEAMEMVEMYCDLMLSRFGIFQQSKGIDDGLVEAIASLIWAAPRLQAEVSEMKIIGEQLAAKYGKPFAKSCQQTASSVNQQLVQKLTIQAPPKVLVEKYLIEIARSHNVPYEPDTEAMEEEPAQEAIETGTLINLYDDSKPPDPGFIPGPPSTHVYPGIQFPQPDLPKPFNYPEPTGKIKSPLSPPPVPSIQPSGPYPGPDVDPNSIGFDSQVPSYDSVFGSSTDKNEDLSSAPTPAPRLKPPIDHFPELPSVPNTALSGLDDPKQSDDVDFDDLARRFEELKKRK